MKQLLILLISITTIHAKAQYCGAGYYDENFQNILSARVTYIERTGDAQLDAVLEDAMAKYWTITKYEFTDRKKMQKEAPKTNVAFLALYRHIGGRGMKSFTISEFALIAGGKDTISYENMVASAYLNDPYNSNGKPISYYNPPTVEPNAFVHLLPNVIKGINDAVLLVKKDQSKIKDIVKGQAYMNIKFYNQRAGILKSKTLCVLASNVENPEKIAKGYPYKIEFLNQKDFDKVVDGKRMDAVYLIINWSDPMDHVLITDPIKHEVVYGRFVGIISTMDAGDFKKIAQAAEQAK